MRATNDINEWIARYGSARDALNIAITKLQAHNPTESPEWTELMNLCECIYRTQEVNINMVVKMKRLLKYFGRIK